MEREEERRQVRRALAGLGERNREAISLYYVDGLSYAEIASYLRVTLATVRGRLDRGRSELRREMTMVARTFREQGLPEDFAQVVRERLEEAADVAEQHGRVVQELSELGAPVVGPLCQALADRREQIRVLAARALCQIGDERALHPILRFLFASAEQAAPEVLLHTRTARRIPRLRDFLLTMVESPMPTSGPEWLQGFCILILAGEGNDPDVHEGILRTFRNQDLPINTRNAALEALCRLRPESAGRFLEEALVEEAFRCRSGAAWYVALRDGHRLSIETCLRGFDGPVAGISRWMAGHLLLRHGRKGTEVLEELLRHGRADQRATAALALDPQTHPKTFDVLLKDLQQRQEDAKWHRMVARALARRFPHRLLRWSGGRRPDPDRQPMLGRAVARARPITGRGDIRDILLCGSPEARKSAVRQLATEVRAEAIPVLRRCLREGRPQKVAREAFRQMRRLRDAAMPTVLDMLDSPHWGERKAAVGLLRQWGQLTDAQEARALADSHIAVRHAAVGRRFYPASPSAS